MACNCINRKKDLNYVRSIANKYVVGNRESVQIYKRGNIYDFEPIKDTNDNIIEYIRYS